MSPTWVFCWLSRNVFSIKGFWGDCFVWEVLICWSEAIVAMAFPLTFVVVVDTMVVSARLVLLSTFSKPFPYVPFVKPCLSGNMEGMHREILETNSVPWHLYPGWKDPVSMYLGSWWEKWEAKSSIDGVPTCWQIWVNVIGHSFNSDESWVLCLLSHSTWWVGTLWWL